MDHRTLIAAAIAVIIASLLERLSAKYITRNHWLNTGLYLLVYPIVLGFFYSEIPMWGVQVINALGLAALFVSFWSAERKRIRELSATQGDALGSAPDD